MKDEQILANAPEGATHVDDDFGFWILSEDQNIKSQSWIDARKGFRCLSIDGFSFRSLADIKTIVELRKQVAELEDTVNYMERVHNKIVGAILDLDEMEQDSEEMANAEQDLLELAKSSKVYGVPSEYRDISGEKNLALEQKIAKLEKNLKMLERYNGSVESLVDGIEAHNLEQQALMCDWIYTNIPDLSNKNYIAIKNKAKQLREGKK